jgi:hypothetical protein
MRATEIQANRFHSRFVRHEGGGASLQAAMLFGAIGMAMAVLVAPMLQGAVDYYADNRALGIDRVMTGGIAKGDRKTVRKSVLDPQGSSPCKTVGDNCAGN